MSLEDNLYPLLKLYEAAPQPVKSLAGRAYRAIPAQLRYGQNYTRFQNEARDVELGDADTIRRYQIQALRAATSVTSIRRATGSSYPHIILLWTGCRSMSPR